MTLPDDPAPAGHWPVIARRWSLVGPPLRPSADDVAVYAEVARSRPAPRALILGVTPEIYRLPWPDGADVVAVDHTRAMIEAVWPGPPDAAVCADWTDLPLESGSRHLAFCDGGLHLLPYPEGQSAVVESLARVLAPGGLLALRLFVPPDPPVGVDRETAAAVIDDLHAGRIASLNVLKLRLGMALQRDAHAGVVLGSVYDRLLEAAPDLPALAAAIGWPLDQTLAIDSYRGSTARYSFASLDQVRDLFCMAPGGFDLVSVRTPTYDLGERCPILVLRRTGPTEESEPPPAR